MLTENELCKIEERFQKAVTVLGDNKEKLLKAIAECSDDEAACLKYLYGYMPVSDMADYDVALFLSFVRHSLMLKSTMPWGKAMEWDIFLNYVLQYRINNENIEFFSKEFYDELEPRIKSMTMYDAVLEVNYWCFEKATYHSTDDRTASPFTVIKNAYGRCGEESTLCVAALRSVGIPARQCYTPRWAHCDDNHAWVEVWVEGTWHFLGACEPEGRLDTGWFRLPASKALLIHNRVLSDLVRNETITMQNDKMTEINVLSHYADVKEITVKVLDSAGNPLPGIFVAFEVVNYSEFYPLATLKTNEAGEVSFVTGLGDLVITAYNDSLYSSKKLDVREQSTLIIKMPKTLEEPDELEYALVPPKGGIENEEPIENEDFWKKKNQYALDKRSEYEASFYNEEKAQKYAEAFGEYRDKLAALLVLARGNYKEIIRFWEHEETKNYRHEKLLLLSSLREKDLTDISAELLLEHLCEAVPYKEQYDEKLFAEYVLCPRIWFENITLYRKGILEYFTKEQREEFIKDKHKLYDYLTDEIKIYNDSEYSNLTTSPLGAMKIKTCNELSFKILITAVLRSLGVAAKIDKVDKRAAYYENGKWNYFTESQEKQPRENKEALLVLKKANDESFSYYKNYTVSHFENGHYTSLNMEDIPWKENLAEYSLVPGKYRIITANRQSNGENLIKIWFLTLKEGERKELLLELLKGEKQVNSVKIPDERISVSGSEQMLSELLRDKLNIVAWIQTSAEPTEHLLNEIIEAKDLYNEKKPNVVLLVEKEEELKNVTLQKALSAVPHIVVGIKSEGMNALNQVYDGFQITDKRLPLAVTTGGQTANHAWSGYNVGIGELLLKHLS